MTSPFKQKTATKAKSPFGNVEIKNSPIKAPTISKIPKTPVIRLTEEEIESLGSATGTSLRAVSGQMLSFQQNNSNDEMTSRLNTMMLEAKKLDPDSIKQAKGISKFIKKIMGVKENLFAEFKTIETRINELSEEIMKDIRKQNDSLVFLDNLKRSVGEFLLSMERDLQILQAEYENTEEDFNLAGPEDKNELQTRLDLILTRVADIKGFRILCVQMGQRIDNMKKTSKMLNVGAKNLLEKAIPAYAASFSIYITAKEQVEAAKTQNNIIDGFNDVIQKGNEMANVAQIEATKLSNKQTVSLETLNHAKESMFNLFDEVDRLNKEARANTLEYIKAADDLESDIAKRIRDAR